MGLASGSGFQLGTLMTSYMPPREKKGEMKKNGPMKGEHGTRHAIKIFFRANIGGKGRRTA